MAAPAVRGWRDWAVPVGLWSIVTAANLFKPFHMDDTAHLAIARWIASNPLHPMSGPLNWDGIVEPIWHTNQPHLLFYLMAGWGSLLGFSEPAMHSLLAIFALLAILVFHRLARHLAPAHADWLTALLVLCPAFIVEQNMMVDVPLLALWLCFFAPLILGSDAEGPNRRFILAGSACAAALLVKYSSLVLVCVLVLHLVAERRWRQLWVVLIPVAALAAWSAFNWFDYGGIHILDRPVSEYKESRIEHLRVSTLGWLATLGAILPLGWIALGQATRHRGVAIGLYAAVTAALVGAVWAVAAGRIPGSATDPWLVRMFKLNGILMLLAVAWNVFARWRVAPPWRGPALLLIVWIGAASAFYILYSPFMAPRHVLLVIPPVLLLVAPGSPARLPGYAKLWGLGITASISAALIVADWSWAAFAREEAQRIAAERRPGQRVLVAGHWGWQWYAGRHGLEQIDVRRTRIAPGDLVVAGLDWGEYGWVPGPNLVPVRRDTGGRPGRWVFCTMRNIGFYASGAGIPPWTLNRDCTASYRVFAARAAPSAR